MGISKNFDYNACNVAYVVVNAKGDLSVQRKKGRKKIWGYVAINNLIIKERVSSLFLGQKKALCADIFAHLHSVEAKNWKEIREGCNNYLENYYTFS